MFVPENSLYLIRLAFGTSGFIAPTDQSQESIEIRRDCKYFTVPNKLKSTDEATVFTTEGGYEMYKYNLFLDKQQI